MSWETICAFFIVLGLVGALAYIILRVASAILRCLATIVLVLVLLAAVIALGVMLYSILTETPGNPAWFGAGSSHYGHGATIAAGLRGGGSPQGRSRSSPLV